MILDMDARGDSFGRKKWKLNRIVLSVQNVLLSLSINLIGLKYSSSVQKIQVLRGAIRALKTKFQKERKGGRIK